MIWIPFSTDSVHDRVSAVFIPHSESTAQIVSRDEPPIHNAMHHLKGEALCLGIAQFSEFPSHSTDDLPQADIVVLCLSDASCCDLNELSHRSIH